jgi:hypothetical protein
MATTSTWGVFSPRIAPLRGRCPVCNEIFDDGGCRINWRRPLTEASREDSGIAEVLDVDCTRWPVGGSELPGWFTERFVDNN